MPVAPSSPVRTPVAPPVRLVGRGLRGFALLRTIPLSPAEWHTVTGSPFSRRA